jgi:hypothetical protein
VRGRPDLAGKGRGSGVGSPGVRFFVVPGVGRCSGDGEQWRRGSPTASASPLTSWPAVEVSKRLGWLQWSCEDVEEGFRGFKGRRN